MLTSQEILNQIETHGQELRALGVRRLGLFGSVVRGEATESSDLDFVVEMEQKTFDAYMDIKERLETLFKRRIDLIPADSIKPTLKARILRETVYAEGL